MAAAAEASLLCCEGVQDAECLPLLVFDRPRWGFEEAVRRVVECLRVPFDFPKSAGHRKGRCRSSRPEEDCLYALWCNVRFEARTNMLQGLTCTGEATRPGVTADEHKNGQMQRKELKEKDFFVSRS